jgi:SNF2 family DNA or RNA helicase
MHKLRPHQVRALAYATPRSRIFLAMEMRTGKTAVTIRWARARGLKKILVVAPLSTINPGWVEELEGEGVPKKRIHILTEIKKGRRQRIFKRKDGWHLINYEYVRTHPELLEELGDEPTHGIVLDESTRIRSPKAQITKVLIKNTEVEHRALLSGLPNPESVLNWFQQIVFQKGEMLGTDNFWAFRGRHFYQPPWSAYEWRPKRGVMEAIKNEVHSNAFILTAKQAGMGSKHIYEKRLVEMNSRQRQLQRSIVKDFEYEETETKWAPVQQTWLARIAGGFSPDGTELISNLKMKELLSIIRNDIPKNASVVVWARFRAEIKALRIFLNSKKIKTMTMTGATNRVKRRLRLQKFQRKEIRVLVIQEKLGMYGLNLAVADLDVYYSNMWDNEVRSQCEKRIEHLTKKRPLLHIDLITRDSVDEEVVPRLREKKLTARQFNLVLKGMIDRWRRVYPLDDAA